MFRTSSDPALRRYAKEYQLTAISVGHRLAPEDPHPAAIDDCFDVAEYFVDHAEAEYGAKWLLAGGASAGADLAVLTVLHLLRSRPTRRLAGVVLPLGFYDLTHNLPKAASFTTPLVINLDALERFVGAYVPGTSIEERRHL
jgi:acetyl esterase/lipase